MNRSELRRRALDRAFYERDAITVAQALLGRLLVLAPRGGELRVARIVETEAYCGPADRACHASRGLTPRTRTLLGPAAHAYVYRIYGMYDCFNVVCGGDDQRGHAVLVRGVEPVVGVPSGLRTDGPGRLTRALGVDRTLDARPLLSPDLFLAEGTPAREVATSARVGVAYAGDHAELPYRFFEVGSACVSRPPRRSLGLGDSTAAEPATRGGRRHLG